MWFVLSKIYFLIHKNHFILDKKDTCLKTKCDVPPYNFVCASNGITYPNECFLKSVSCITKSNLTIEYRGPCKTSNICNYKANMKSKQNY